MGREGDDSRLQDTAPLVEATGAGAEATSAPGGTIGRFVVLGALGKGGMGVVLSAYDPALDRKVALKLLRPDVWRGASESEGRARLMREAQAMARLSHPNVVTVHEVGTVGEQMFVAMEFVDGKTLREWCDAGAHGWRETVRMYAAAGRGLVAAHAAGLVHRDFKPENVLVGGDGRPRVVDFGLVSIPRVAVDADDTGAGEPGATRRGAILGTPGYMSPEQLDGKPSDAQSDQFSFCVALYESLYGHKPFPTEPASAHREAVLHGRVRTPPKKSRVPAWLFDVLARGLRVEPAARWPSMAALLEALAHDPAERRRRRLLVASAALGVVALVGGTVVAVRHARAPVCSGAAARLAGVWDAGQRARVEHAFVATRLPYAADTFKKVAALIDRYTDGWVTMSEEACRATRVEGRQSDSLLDLRMACLDRRRATLAAVTDVWAEGVAPEALENAISAAASLPPVDECADARALADRTPPPRDPAARARIEAVRAHLDRVRALREAKRLQEARAEAEQAEHEADATAYAPLRAEADLVLGSLLHVFGEPAATRPLEDAARQAAAARDDRLAAAAMTELVGTLADSRHSPQAIELAPAAEAFVVRAGNRPEQRGALLFAVGSAYEDAGRYAEARAALSEARALLQRSLGAKDPLTLAVVVKLARVADAAGDYATNKALSDEILKTGTEVLGPEHPQMGILLRNLGLFALHAGDFAGARRLFERSLAIAERAFGPDALQTAMVVNNLGVLAEGEGNLEEAKRDYSRVLAIRRRILGDGHPLVAHALANLSIIVRLEGHTDESLAQVREALSIMQKTYGTAHPDVAYELGLLGDVLDDRGDVAGARQQYHRALDIWTQVKGPTHLDTLGQVAALAEFEGRHGNCGEARRLALPAIAALEKAAPTHPELAIALAAVARCDLRDGKAKAAVPRLERALAIQERPGTSPADRGALRLDLARALKNAGDDEQRADELEAEGERELRHAGRLGMRELHARGY